MTSRKRIEPDPAKQWDAASKAVLVDDTLYLSGQVGLDADGKLVGLDIVSQTDQAVRNIESICVAAGGSLRDVVRITIFITDAALSPGYFEVIHRHFGDQPPAQTGIVVKGLLIPELLVELEAIAVIGSSASVS